jgi:hypothetical protein
MGPAAAAVGHDGNRQWKSPTERLANFAEGRDGFEPTRRIAPQADERRRSAAILPPTEDPIRRLEVRGARDARREGAPLGDDGAELAFAVTEHQLLEP